jgi:hypothetical protein
MSWATNALDQILPLNIDRAEFEDPNLIVGGADWSLSSICMWRWVAADGTVISPAQSTVADSIWDLVGDSIVAVRWSGPQSLGVDPTLELRSGGRVELISDAAFDTWVLRLPDLVLVGPLREG